MPRGVVLHCDTNRRQVTTLAGSAVARMDRWTERRVRNRYTDESGGVEEQVEVLRGRIFRLRRPGGHAPRPPEFIALSQEQAEETVEEVPTVNCGHPCPRILRALGSHSCVALPSRKTKRD